jgi:putrescine aminotransferase
MSRKEAHDLWRKYVNPDMVSLLEAFDFGREFVRAQGTKLYDEAGREYTDFLAGFGVHNIGHNHPRLVSALRSALDSVQPSMLNVDAPGVVGRLAQKLTSLTHPLLCRSAFANSGAEAVEMAIKAARLATGRETLVACDGGYHGLTTGSLAILGAAEIRQRFGTLLPAAFVPFGDAAAAENACRQHRPAAVFVEPIQGEGGIRVPSSSYLGELSAVCRSHGVLLVVDEIQTGLGRCGRMFATDFPTVVPDILLVGKALSGGMVPIAVAMMTDDVWKSAFSGPQRCTLTASTFAGGLLAVTVALEVLSILEQEKLPQQAADLGGSLLDGLEQLAERHKIIAAVRGRGLLAGLEFREPTGLLIRGVPGWARRGLYAQVVAAVLLRDHGFLTQPCSLDQSVLRLEPPLTISPDEISRLLSALDITLAEYPSHTSAAIAAFRATVLRGGL